MATLEDLGRMAMVEVGDQDRFPPDGDGQQTWGNMALILAAGAAVCGLVVGLRRSSENDNSK